MNKAIFYHAGCPVCSSAEQTLSSALDRSRYDLEIVHLGTAKNRIAEAEAVGVKSVQPSVPIFRSWMFKEVHKPANLLSSRVFLCPLKYAEMQ